MKRGIDKSVNTAQQIERDSSHLLLLKRKMRD